MIGRHGGPHRFESTHIDMVPMVDCIMVLVIFLMISSSFVSDPGVEVQKPDVVGALSSDQNAVPSCARRRAANASTRPFVRRLSTNMRRSSAPMEPGRRRHSTWWLVW